MRIAACTMVHNEPVFLPIWADYYGRMLGVDSLFVVDHGSTDGSLTTLPSGTNIIRIPRNGFDEYPRTDLINHLKDGLLQYFDTVIYNDCDELIVPDPLKYKSLTEYCLSSPDFLSYKVVAPIGLNIIHASDREKPIDLRKPILGQRRFCQFYSAMSKPVLVKTATEWCPGFHHTDNIPFYSDDVYLFHLKSIDRNISLEKLETTRTMQWAETNLSRKIGEHQRATDEQHLKYFFEQPFVQLKIADDLTFDFSSERNRLLSSLKLSGKFYVHDRFRGKTAMIPERFWGIF